MDKKRSSIRLVYEYSQDKRIKPQYVHGVWGGINPHGEVEMNFYVEYDQLPEYSECELTSEGRVTLEKDHNYDGSKHIIREINSKLIMNYSTARAVMEWISDQLEMMESCDPDDDFELVPPVDGREQ